MALKIVYWASTIIAAVMLGMALIYLTGNPQVVEGFKHLGYPQYLRIVLGLRNRRRESFCSCRGFVS